MKIKERMQLGVRGNVKWKFSKGRTGLYLCEKHNVITYLAADIMARLLGNDNTYIPQHVGFIYGSTDTTSLVNPDILPDNTKRQHNWDNITTEVAAANANILIAPLVLNPAWSIDGNSLTYNSNAVTMAAFTGTYLEYAFPTDGSTYAHTINDLEAGGFAYFYQALLLNRRVIGSNVVYTPFARVTLEDPETAHPGIFDPKPHGFELSVFWTITFN